MRSRTSSKEIIKEIIKAFHMPKLSHSIIYIYTYSTSMNIQEPYMQETTHCRSKTQQNQQNSDCPGLHSSCSPSPNEGY